MLNALKDKYSAAHIRDLGQGYIQNVYGETGGCKCFVYGEHPQDLKSSEWRIGRFLGMHSDIRRNMLRNVYFKGVDFDKFTDIDYALLANIHEVPHKPFFPIQSLILDENCNFGALGVVGLMELVAQTPTMTYICLSDPKQMTTSEFVIRSILQAMREHENTSLIGIGGLGSSVNNSQAMLTLNNVLKRNQLIAKLLPFMNKKSLSYEDGSDIISTCLRAGELYLTLEKEDQKPLYDAIKTLHDQVSQCQPYDAQSDILGELGGFLGKNPIQTAPVISIFSQ